MGFFDWKSKVQKSILGWKDEILSDPGKMKAYAIIDCLAVMSMADGEMQEEEYEEALAYFNGLEQINDNVPADEADDRFVATCKLMEGNKTVAKVKRRNILNDIQKYITDAETKELAVELSHGMVAADGTIAPEEKEVMAQMCKILGVKNPAV